MSDLPLPDDPERWPENVFELLGVPLGADEKTLKRAYQKLIKVYRPEQYPDEFRRIREAYDTAQSIAEWMASVGELPKPEEADASPTEPKEPASKPDAAGGAPRPPAIATYESTLAAAWQPAVDGDTAFAYRRLDALRLEQPMRYEAYLGLYWLLRLSAKLDSERQPCDWLIACMQSAASGRVAALELYRREIERRPAEALTPRCAQLLRETLLDGPIQLLADWRWRAAVQSNAWGLIREDLAALRRTRVVYDGSSWMQLLRTAVECSSWSDSESSQALTAECLRELEQFGNADDADYEALTQLDYLRETADVVKKLRDEGVAPAFCNLIAGSWSLQPLDLYVELCALVGPMLEEPAELFILLIEVGAKGPAALSRYGQIVRLLQQETERNTETFWTPETAIGVVKELFNMNLLRLGYTSEFRLRLLKFCLYQQLPPEAVAHVLSQNHFYASVAARIAAEIRTDWPLQFTYQTWRLVTL